MTTFGTNNSISRRTFLPLIAAGALAPASLVSFTATAQTPNWQTYRREDLGFEIEMPGTPTIMKDRADDGVVTIDAEVDVDQLHFGASSTAFNRDDMSIQTIADAYRMAAKHLGMSVIKITEMTMNGFPGLDVITESDALSMVLRIVLKPRQSIVAGVTGQGAVSQHPLVRRFLESLKLLP